MSAWFEHERLTHPIMIPLKDFAFLGHGNGRKLWPATGDNAHRIAASVGIHTEETMSHNSGSICETLDPVGCQIKAGRFVINQVRHKTSGRGCLRKSEVAVPEGMDHIAVVR